VESEVLVRTIGLEGWGGLKGSAWLRGAELGLALRKRRHENRVVFWEDVKQGLGMLRVNGELVDQQFVEEAFQRIKAAEEQRLQGPCCERDPEFNEQAEQEVADSILIAQEAEKRFEEIPEEELKPKLKELIDIYREQGASWDFLDQQRDMIRHEIAASMRMDKLIASLLGDENQVTEAEVQAFYEENLEEYRAPAEVRSLHVMKTLNENTTPREVFAKMCALREKVLEGDDFEKMAGVDWISRRILSRRFCFHYGWGRCQG